MYSYNKPEEFPPHLNRAIEYLLDHDGDIEEAAKLAAMELRALQNALAAPAVKAEIKRRRLAEQEAIANAKAVKRVLTAEFLDEQLHVAIEVAAKDGDSKPIELGYERIGMRRDKNFMTPNQASEKTRPMVYSVLERTQTLQVTQREVIAGPLPKPPEPKILDY